MDEGINAGIIASGSGTDANAVMNAYNMGFMPELADLRLISTKGSAGCIGKAEIQKIKSEVIECRSKQEVPDFNLQLNQYIKDQNIQLLILPFQRMVNCSFFLLTCLEDTVGKIFIYVKEKMINGVLLKI